MMNTLYTLAINTHARLQFFTALPCQLDMTSDGVVLAADLSITTVETPTLTTFTLQSPVETYETPIWESVTLAQGNAQTVTVTPVDKDGVPVGPAMTFPVDPTQPTTVYFDSPVTADMLLVEVTPIDTTLPVPLVESVLSCMPPGGKFCLFT